MTYHQKDAQPTRSFPRGRTRTLPIVAIVIAAVIGLVIYSMSGDQTASVNAPAFERSAPDSSTGQGNSPRPAPMQPNAK